MNIINSNSFVSCTLAGKTIKLSGNLLYIGNQQVPEKWVKRKFFKGNSIVKGDNFVKINRNKIVFKNGLFYVNGHKFELEEEKNDNENADTNAGKIVGEILKDILGGISNATVIGGNVVVNGEVIQGDKSVESDNRKHTLNIGFKDDEASDNEKDE